MERSLVLIKPVAMGTGRGGAIISRLEKKGFLESRLSDPTPKRGGKSKRYYTLSSQGVKTLAEVKRVHSQVWAGTEDLPSAP